MIDLLYSLIRDKQPSPQQGFDGLWLIWQSDAIIIAIPNPDHFEPCHVEKESN